MHLAVHPADLALHPSEAYLSVQDALIVACGGFWVLAYCLYIYQAYVDKSYGMPLLPLCANVAWELYYGIIIPSNQFESIAFLAWFVVDVFLVLVTIRYASRQDPSSFLMRHAGFSIWVGTLLMLLLHAKYATYYADAQEAAFWSGLFCELILSWNAPVHLVMRQNVKGHSLEIWYCRSLGTLFAILVFAWRAANYPSNWSYARTPWAGCLIVGLGIPELAYPFVYRYFDGGRSGRVDLRKCS